MSRRACIASFAHRWAMAERVAIVIGRALCVVAVALWALGVGR